MSLKWTVPELLQFKDEGLQFSETVSVPSITERDKEIRDVSLVKVQGFTEFQKRAITFHLIIDGEMILPSSITLKDVDFPFHFQTSETFRLDDSYEPLDDDEEVHDVVENTIDLIPYIEEAIMVQKPIRVISETAKEDALPSGEGWEFVTEQEQKNRIDPRLKDLKKFFDK